MNKEELNPGIIAIRHALDKGGNGESVTRKIPDNVEIFDENGVRVKSVKINNERLSDEGEERAKLLGEILPSWAISEIKAITKVVVQDPRLSHEPTTSNPYDTIRHVIAELAERGVVSVQFVDSYKKCVDFAKEELSNGNSVLICGTRQWLWGDKNSPINNSLILGSLKKSGSDITFPIKGKTIYKFDSNRSLSEFYVSDKGDTIERCNNDVFKNKAYNKGLDNTFLAGKDIESKKFFDTETKMMCEEPWGWSKKEGKLNVGEGDALWRTGLAYITWKKPLMLEGILECYREFGGNSHFKKKRYQAMRHTGRVGEDDVSRDQVIMSLSALKVNKNLNELSEISSKLPYRLSRKFRMTPDMWAWKQTFTKTKAVKFYTNLFCILNFLEKVVALNFNMFIAKVCGLKRVKNNEYTSRYHYNKKDNWNWFQKKLMLAYYSGYAFHLSCWQIYTLPKNYNPWTKKILLKIMRWYCEDENYLLRLLLGDKSITWEQVESYESRENFRWEAFLDGSWPNYQGEMPDDWKEKYLKHNQLDKDCLKVIWHMEVG